MWASSYHHPPPSGCPNGKRAGTCQVDRLFHPSCTPILPPQLSVSVFLFQTVHGLITAVTALIAGLQLKLKLSEKAERYRKGAKIYGRLLRISSYYLMMVESGGKVDDVTGLWRDAMRKEEKWIPFVRSYVPLWIHNDRCTTYLLRFNTGCDVTKNIIYICVILVEIEKICHNV